MCRNRDDDDEVVPLRARDADADADAANDARCLIKRNPGWHAISLITGKNPEYKASYDMYWCTKLTKLISPLAAEKWRVVRVLGQGAYGVAFLIVNPAREQRVIKVIGRGSREVAMHRRFEAVHLAPRIYWSAEMDMVHTYARHDIIMMEPAAFTLANLVCMQTLPRGFVQILARSFAMFLWQMYADGLSHGDMHGNNIMFKYNEASGVYDAILIDFGLARDRGYQFYTPDTDVQAFKRFCSAGLEFPPVALQYMVNVMGAVKREINALEVARGGAPMYEYP